MEWTTGTSEQATPLGTWMMRLRVVLWIVLLCVTICVATWVTADSPTLAPGPRGDWTIRKGERAWDSGRLVSERYVLAHVECERDLDACTPRLDTCQDLLREGQGLMGECREQRDDCLSTLDQSRAHLQACYATVGEWAGASRDCADASPWVCAACAGGGLLVGGAGGVLLE